MIRMTVELVDYFSALLRLPREKVLTNINLLDLGTDSIMLIEAQRHLDARFGLRIELQEFFEELNTIDKIAARLIETGEAEASARDVALAPARPEPSRPETLAPRPAHPSVVEPSIIALLRSQLALVAETIEAQNRILIKQGPFPIPQSETLPAGVVPFEHGAKAPGSAAWEAL